MRFTVFTPTYNRAHTLERLYDSLLEQTLTDFEWLVVDDASTDATPDLLGELSARRPDFVRSIRMERNGGKHRAINRAVREARGELFLIVDSDDLLATKALEAIDAVEKSIPSDVKREFAGVCGLRAYSDGREVGTTFQGRLLDITTLNRAAHGITGDKVEVVYTAVMQRYPFPEFPGENFLTEAVVWDRIAHDGLKFRFFNEFVSFGDYLADGLSHNVQELTRNNPQGDALYIRQTAAWGELPPRRVVDLYVKYLDAHREHMSTSDIARALGLRNWQLRTLLTVRKLWHIRQ